jgi:hypothetical protein
MNKKYLCWQQFAKLSTVRIFVPERGAVFRGRNMDTNIVIQISPFSGVLKEILRAFVRGLHSTLHRILNNVLSMQ